MLTASPQIRGFKEPLQIVLNLAKRVQQEKSYAALYGLTQKPA